MKDRIPTQLTAEECATADPTRQQLNAAKQSARDACLASKRGLLADAGIGVDDRDRDVHLYAITDAGRAALAVTS